ncbi:MAG: hypothetical protein AAFV95_19415 [Bacteroidota bacterium]
MSVFLFELDKLATNWTKISQIAGKWPFRDSFAVGITLAMKKIFVEVKLQDCETAKLIACEWLRGQ